MTFVRTGKAAALVAAAFALHAGPAAAATIEPDTFADGLAITGNCTLREAIQSATLNVAFDECAKGSASKTDVVQLGDGEYDLTVTAIADEDDNFNGDLDYTGGGKLVITGPKPGKSYIDSTVAARVIEASGEARSLTLKRLFIENGDMSAEPNASGGNIDVTAGRLTMNRVDVLNGTAESTGGGLRFSSDRGARITKSYFAGNSAVQGGGVAMGGDGRSTITKTDFGDNHAVDGAARGGALSAFGDVLILDSMFLGNTASSDGGGSALGGAIYGTDFTVERSTFTDNATSEAGETVGADGGAIRAFDITVRNSTFFSNESADQGGAVRASGKLSHISFDENDAEDGGNHISGPPVGAESRLAIRNSILPLASIFSDICAETEIRSKGYNAFGGSGDCPTRDSDLIFGFGAGYKDKFPDGNGGRTFTLDLTADSPAKDLVPLRKCGSSKGEDQRGFKRPKGSRCDAGALERGAAP